MELREETQHGIGFILCNDEKNFIMVEKRKALVTPFVMNNISTYTSEYFRTSDGKPIGGGCDF